MKLYSVCENCIRIPANECDGHYRFSYEQDNFLCAKFKSKTSLNCLYMLILSVIFVVLVLLASGCMHKPNCVERAKTQHALHGGKGKFITGYIGKEKHVEYSLNMENWLPGFRDTGTIQDIETLDRLVKIKQDGRSVIFQDLFQKIMREGLDHK